VSNIVELSIPPPEDQAANVERFENIAMGMRITDGSSSLAAQAVRVDINAALVAVDEKRKSLTAPIRLAEKKINDFFRPYIERLTQARRLTDSKIISWDNAQDLIRQESQRKADEAARIERERLQAIADKASAKGQTAKAENFQSRAETTVAPVIMAETPRGAGVRLPKRWTFRILDASKLRLAFLSPDEVAIGKIVRAMGTEAHDLVGHGAIEITEEKSVSSRRT
jgi:hypothetical protein